MGCIVHFSSWTALYLVASDVSELVDGHVLVEVRAEDHALAIAGGLKNPDLKKTVKMVDLLGVQVNTAEMTSLL